MNAVTFGKYLRKLRKSKGLTVPALAAKLESSVSHINMIECDHRNPPPETIRKLAAALGCTHIGMMIKAGHVTEQEVFGWIETHEPSSGLRVIGD